MGIFRISNSVALVIGNLDATDDINIRMMKETLGGIYTLPILNEPNPPAAQEKGAGHL